MLRGVFAQGLGGEAEGKAGRCAGVNQPVGSVL